MDTNFKGKRALVTGAAGDLGSAIVSKLIQCGAEVIALDVNEEGLQRLKEKLPDIITLCVDLKDWNATKRAVEECPYIDLLVNNAAVICPQEVGRIDEETFDRVFGINAKAVLNVSQVIAERMKGANQEGAIVNVSSQAAKKCERGILSYVVSKAAVDAVTRCLALELGPHKIRVNAVNPTAINTQMYRRGVSRFPAMEEKIISSIPLGRIAEPEEIADVILFLLSDNAAMMNGATVPVDGGATVH